MRTVVDALRIVTSVAPDVPSPTASPVARLVAGLCAAVLVIVGFSLYTAREIGRLRDEQVALSERNRLDSLQIMRIQQNLSTLAATLRDMLDRTEPYPMTAWANTFTRLRGDLEQAFVRERELAPVGPPAAERAQLEDVNRRFWETLDRAFVRAQAGDDDGAAALVRGEATARHAELVSVVSQLFIRNTRVDEAAATRARGIYDRVAREIYLLAGVLVAALAVGGIVLIRATRRTFEAVQTLSAERRALSWRVLRMQEDLQTTIARELHDEFGQILTALGTMLGRIRRNADRLPAPGSGLPEGAVSTREPEFGGREPEAGSLLTDLDDVRVLAQRTLDRIRTQSRMLHPVILDDFGLQQALVWYVGEFARQHAIAARFEPAGELGTLPAEVTVHLYRIVQEALNNVARHAHATEAVVRLAQSGDGVALEVEDNGRGLPAESSAGRPAGGGIGITSMRERAELMGGTLLLRRASSANGLIVSVRVPVRVAAAS
jgi:signal transduction histidine kinase